MSNNNGVNCPINADKCPKESLINSIAEYVAFEREKADARRRYWTVFVNSIVGSLAVLIFSGLVYIGKVVIDSFK